jgi:hypothetical protein
VSAATQGHTPGPWAVGEVSEHFRDADRMVYCDDSLGSRVADCTQSGHCITVAQERANARLIAAAPQLVEALQELVQKRLEKASSPQEADGSDGRYARARAALSAAGIGEGK